MRERLARNSQRVAYPYLRQIPALPIGCAFTLRNPILSPLTQIREVIDGARADADLNARLAQRTRRREFIDILLQGKLFSVYEPVVDAKTLTVFGYEALVRGSEGSGLASPAELFGTASDEGLLFELDCQCRRAAVEGSIGFPAGAKLFMNIRPTAIHDPSFQPDALTRTLDRCGLAPSDVVFEISEQESIDNYDDLPRGARRLRQARLPVRARRHRRGLREPRGGARARRPSSSRSIARSCTASTRTPRARTSCARSRPSRRT